MRKLCVYVWKRPDTNSIFYVGHGSKKRALSRKYHSKEFMNTIDELYKNGLMPSVHIVKDNLSLLEALQFESHVIHICMKRNEPLVNKNSNWKSRR
jgi:hypothetical protein